MIITIISSLALAYNRCKGMETEKKPASLLSREGAFLLTNIILIILVTVIFTGTFLPKIVEVIRGTKLAIDRSFFDRTCGPVMLVLVLLMGICPVLGWSRTTWQFIKRNLFYVSIIAIVIAIVVLITGIGNWYALAVIICGIPLGTIFLEWYRRTRGLHRAREENIIRGFFSVLNRNRGRYGGFISHIGVILIALGIIVSSFYDIEKTETLSVGESMDIGNYNLTYNELVLKQDNVKLSAVASLSVNRNNRRTGIMYPSYDYWFDFNDCFAEVAVRTTPVEDLFVSLVWTSYNPEDNTATFRVLVNPMVVWIWVGGGFFLVGGAIAFSAKDSLSIIKE